MNKKYTFKWTAHEDFSIPDNNYNSETESVVCEPPYDFGDYLSDYLEYQYEQDGDTYYIIDDDGKRTGEAYFVISAEDTDERLTAE